jgi:hypothetical protein
MIDRVKNVEKLLNEGFSSDFICKLDDKQLNLFTKHYLNETLTVSQKTLQNPNVTQKVKELSKTNDVKIVEADEEEIQKDDLVEFVERTFFKHVPTITKGKLLTIKQK